VLLLRSTWAGFQGRLAEANALADEALAMVQTVSQDADQEHTVQRLALAKLSWRPLQADRSALRAYAARYADLPVWAAMLANLAWDLGRADEARQALSAATRDDLTLIEQTADGLAAAALLAEPAVGLGDARLVARLHELLAPHAERNPVMDHAWTAWGPVARPLGLLAGALGRGDEAAAYFARAAELTRAWGSPGWELRVLGDWLASGAGGAPREALLARGLYLSRELELPWVAALLADAAELGKTTP
jgi:hypothetical protein